MMRPDRSLIAVLSNTTAEQKYESLSWLLYNLFGSTVPIWLGGYVLLPVFSRHFNWIEYSSHGELALYSAAFLAPTLRLIGRDVEDSQFVRRQTFLFFGWIFLTAAVALYSGVISASEMPPNSIHVNTNLLFSFSLFLFIVSVLFSSLVRLIDFQRIPPKEFFALQKASVKHLDEEFEKTAPAGEAETPLNAGAVPEDPAVAATNEEPPVSPTTTNGVDKLNDDFDQQ